MISKPYSPSTRLSTEDKGKVVDLVKEMAAHLVARGWDAERLMWRANPRGTHSEASWRRRLPRALRFIYQKREG